MKTITSRIIYAVFLLAFILMPLHAQCETPSAQTSIEAVAESWSWAKEKKPTANPKNAGKSRKLRKKGLAASSEQEQQAWALLGNSMCALAGAERCSNGTAVFETSLKSNSNKTIQVMKKEEL